MAKNEDARVASKAVWSASPAGTTHAPQLEPGTLEFFQRVRAKRRDYELTWLEELIPFASTANKRVLEVGCGAGFDAFEFCQSGADYLGIDLTPENVQRTRQHLSAFGLQGEIQLADAEALPFDDGSFDVVFSNGVLHHTPDMPRAVREAYRVLRTGGEAWIIVYHRHSVFYWVSTWLFGHVLNGGFLRRSFQERLSAIEYTTSDALPLVTVHTRPGLRAMLRQAGFEVNRIQIRKLNREDLPGNFGLHRIQPLIPQSLLDRLGRSLGWYLIAKARKPAGQ